MFSPLPPRDRSSPRAPRHASARRALTVALLIAIAPATASAATIAVTTPDDSDPTASSSCTLRQAILSMNSAMQSGSCINTGAAFGNNDTITFAASSIAGATMPGTVTLADSADTSGNHAGTLVITANQLTIDASAWRGNGPGLYADGVTIARPNGASHAFGILKDTAPAGSLLVLNGVALRNGEAGDGGGVGMGAADLSMTDSRVSGNKANSGGGISSQSGDIALTRCTIDDNVGYLGGGIGSGSGMVTVTSTTISGNGEWAVSHGGGIDAEGTLLLVDSTISGNVAKRGAGIRVGGVASLVRSVVTANDSYYLGGGVHVLADAMITVASSTINGNSARYAGGGVYAEGDLIATNSTIAGNGAGDGGGLFLTATGMQHLDHVTLSLNHANHAGGGIGGSGGGGTLDRSIVSGNTAPTDADIATGVGWTGVDSLVANPSVALGALQDNGGATPTMLPGAGSTAIDVIAPHNCTQSSDQRGMPRPWGAGCDVGAVEAVPDAIFANGFDDADRPLPPQESS